MVSNRPPKPTKSWAERRIIPAVEAFRRLTGKSPNEPEAQDAWRLFFEAAQSVGEPTPERAAWVTQSVKKFHATDGLLKSRVLQALWGRAETPQNYRHALREFDALFAILTDEEISDAFAPLWMRRARRDAIALKNADADDLRGWFQAIAKVALSVGALGAKRGTKESVARALRRLSNTYRVNYANHQRTRRAEKKPT